MIKFFRQIRYDLLEKNKVGQYLKYAIGEIILVVIGILIALSINNLNEDRILKNKEQAYLKSLQSEFLVSQIKLENLMKVNRENYEAAKELLARLEKHTAPVGEDTLSQLGYNSFGYEIAYYPNNAVLNEMISSGSLRDISNDDLRKHLASWGSFLESIKLQEQDLRIQREKVRDMFRRDNASIRTIFDQTGISTKVLGLEKAKESYSNLDLFKSREFENNVLTFVITSISVEEAHYGPLLEEIQTIRSLIDTEVEP
jgi:hypothetical protein